MYFNNVPDLAFGYHALDTVLSESSADVILQKGSFGLGD
jgi:hypothetical protein